MIARTSRRLVGAGLFALLLVAGIAILIVNRSAAPPQGTNAGNSNRPEPLIAGAFSPPYDAPDFTLAGSNKSDVKLSRYRGKVVLLAFGFTHCAAVCPTTLATLAQARKELGATAGAVQVVFVTVDPDRDKAADMQAYLAAFDPTFVGATGSPEELASVRQKYGVTAVKQGEGPDYAMAHTSSIFMIDPVGKLRALMPFGHDAADFVHDIRYLSVH